MYSHNNTTFSSSESPSPSSVKDIRLPVASSHLIIPDHLTGFEFGSSSSASSSYDSPSSLASCCLGQQPSSIQRSTSSHSLNRKNGYLSHFHHDLLDLDFGTVRRVSSTGDLQTWMRDGHKADSPLSSESYAIIESMNRACKYSPEEKKERIERYKSKRTQRNFNKKIKYACRKTLADSRPRVRGRFARNKEIEKNVEAQWSNEEDEDDSDNWLDLLNAFC